MSVLKDKKILCAGHCNEHLTNVCEEVQAHGVNVIKTKPDEVTPELVHENQPDMVFINCTGEDSENTNLLTGLHNAKTTETTPVIAIVDGTPDSVQEAFSRGATDYIATDETLDSVLNKMKAVLGVSENFSSSASIDITPEHVHVQGKGIKVFIVEDDPLLRNLLSIRFEKSDFPHEFSSDGKDAILAITQFQPDIILLDIMLPGMNGFDLMETLKANKELRDIPVLIFSNRDSQEDRERAEKLGAAGFYVKAMTDLSEIVETIETIVNG